MIRFIKDFLSTLKALCVAMANNAEATKVNAEEQKQTRLAIDRLCANQNQFIETLRGFLSIETNRRIAEEKKQIAFNKAMEETPHDLRY